jgi:NADPH2:quinone reductase
MTHAIRIHAPGGPDAFVWETVDVSAPGEGQAVIRHTAIGVNFIDVYHRTGLYPLPAMPAIIGMEGAGVIEAVGPGVTDVAVGDRVAYACAPPGAYAERRVVPAAQMVKLPAAIGDVTGAAMMLKGMTAQYLLKSTAPVQAGDVVLVHAAAGGVGLLLCQWAKHLGCTVIGTAGSDEKAALARAHGCDHPIVYTRENFAERVKAITGGKGAHVIYDGIGKDTFEGSLDALAITGRLVCYGQASGPIPPISLSILSAKSATISRPVMFHYTGTRADLLRVSGDLMDVVAKGAVKIETPRDYALKDAAQSHRDLEGRKTTGALVLMP